MNLKSAKTLGIVALGGYGFFAVDHFHRAILEHSYHVALVGLGVWAVCAWSAKSQKDNAENERTITQILNRRPLIEKQPAECSHTINLKQPEHVSR